MLACLRACLCQSAQERGNPLLASLNAKAASYVNFKHFLAEYKEVRDVLSCQATPFNFARVGLVADLVPCGPWARSGGDGEAAEMLRMLPLSELEHIQAQNSAAGGGGGGGGA